ncbi:mRNA capping enzyme, alpha subunit [Corynespora cassiicola Philippines]|uniref:mRNA-capping enzyme subunit alpha n=1 Tax=Corynespora cassiicola Philippines TaxID=1448308 RepID=A0A2T2P886_CORCC|nr:mRNA capping enzyme, alpha subunit [Corynespora cassiicola Philippines]
MSSSVPPQIPGYLVTGQQASELKQAVSELLERDNLRFPGAQPVSFGREHIAELQRSEYFMCEKTDGIRCLLYLAWNERPDVGGFEPVTYLIDRKNNYYDVSPPIRFPYYNAPLDPNMFLFGTILDGELVHDTYPGEAKPRLIFYVFDCLAIDNENLTPRPLDKRLGKMQQMIFEPQKKWLNHIKQNVSPEPFIVKEKTMFPPYALKMVFENVLPNLKHGNDGLIFTCKSTRYEFGTDKHILKWKPPHENTIDFKLKLGNFPVFDPEDGEEGLIEDYDAMPDRFELQVQHNKDVYKPFEHDLFVDEAEWEIFKSLNQRLDGRIIECYRDESGRWRFKPEHDGKPRWRDDKKDANHISTVLSVLESIDNPVTQRDLLDNEDRIKDAVKKLREFEKRKMQQWQHDQERDAKKRKLSEANLNGSPS